MFISDDDQKKLKRKESYSLETLSRVISTYRKLRLNAGVSRFIEQNPLELALFDAMDIGVYMIDYEIGTYAYANKALSKMLGIRPNELLNAPISKMSEFVHPSDFQILLRITEKASEVVKKMGGTEREQMSFKVFYRIKKTDGAYCWCLQTNKIIKDRITGGSIDLGLLICLPEQHGIDKVSGYLKTSTKSMEINGQQDTGNPLSKLSSREKEVLILVGRGLSTNEISKILSLSSETIKIHRKKILRKLNVTSSIHAVALLQKFGKVY
jgi:DNA-binding CsgD family transcriptional regulator